MFTGIIECTGEIVRITREGDNVHVRLKTDLAKELKVDQSVSHDGVRLTVTAVDDQEYEVTAIAETLSKTNLNTWKNGKCVNLERCLMTGNRLDGHWVQGHVDSTGVVDKIQEEKGSYRYHIRFPGAYNHLIVDKGSICLNGVSLTIVDAGNELFDVAVIPYTYEHTNLRMLSMGDPVNLEFDIMGKYLARWRQLGWP